MKTLEKKNKGGLWNATFGELIATFQILEKNGFTLEMLKQLREKGGEEKAKKIVSIFLETISAQGNYNYEDLKIEWQNFYAKYFNLKVDLSGIKISALRTGFDRLIIIIPGISPDSVVVAQRQYFKTWVFNEDLDAAIAHNDRDASNEPYAIWVRDTVEPDQKYRNRSANWAKEKQISGETILERLIHGLKYWDEKKKHLDINGTTMCTGSRHSCGQVPRVDLGSVGIGVRVFWYDPGSVLGSIGPREIVSCIA